MAHWTWPRKGEKIDSEMVYTLMPFKKGWPAEVFHRVTTAAANCGLYAKKSDLDMSREIIKEMFNNLARAQFIVVDITGANANVFYEAGVCDVLGKHVISLTADDPKKAPFDLKDVRLIRYSLENLEAFQTDLESSFKHAKTEVDANGRNGLTHNTPVPPRSSEQRLGSGV